MLWGLQWRSLWSWWGEGYESHIIFVSLTVWDSPVLRDTKQKSIASYFLQNVNTSKLLSGHSTMATILIGQLRCHLLNLTIQSERVLSENWPMVILLTTMEVLTVMMPVQFIHWHSMMNLTAHTSWNSLRVNSSLLILDKVSQSNFIWMKMLWRLRYVLSYLFAIYLWKIWLFTILLRTLQVINLDALQPKEYQDFRIECDGIEVDKVVFEFSCGCDSGNCFGINALYGEYLKCGGGTVVNKRIYIFCTQ